MPSAPAGHESCSGCSLCLLACPVWRATRDIRLTPHGRAKALQHGAAIEELADSIDSCTLCGACEPACPEEIDLSGMIMKLRRELAASVPDRAAQAIEAMQQRLRLTQAAPDASTRLVPDRGLGSDAGLLARVLRLLGAGAPIAVAADDGSDIARALEAGAPIPEARRERFIGPLSGARRLIVADGLLFRALRAWLPRAQIESLGRALSALAEVRGGLRPGDMYVIEPRAYHADRERLVTYYDALGVTLGLSTNLDLQRLAIPTTAGSLPAGLGCGRVDPLDQARWILEGRECARVVVEDLNDVAVFRQVTDRPVFYLAELASSESKARRAHDTTRRRSTEQDA